MMTMMMMKTALRVQRAENCDKNLHCLTSLSLTGSSSLVHRMIAFRFITPYKIIFSDVSESDELGFLVFGSASHFRDIMQRSLVFGY